MSAPSGAEMDVCQACGVLRAPGHARCESCDRETTARVPRSPETCWVRIECAFKCHLCGFVVPLNHLGMDGAVLCARCGLEQAFDVSRFEDALALAHHAGEVFREGILGGSAPGLDDGISRLGRLGITKIGTT